ncbi:MAG: tryptophan synthase subunit alpha [Pirellulaceae bacterium]
MSLEQLFQQLRSTGKKALMPFIAAGDPDWSMTERLLEEFAGVGCSMCELGFPYSDPIADGPTIQAAFTRALQNGIKVQSIFSALKQKQSPLPTVAMLSYSIVHRLGVSYFTDEASSAGFQGLIVPDLPWEEADDLKAACDRNGLALIPLITPTTSDDRAKDIVQRASGFIYYVSVTGVTGQRQDLPPAIIDNLGRLRELTSLPICVGFGISEPEHIRALAPYCDGMIVGSAIVRRIESGLNEGKSQEVIAQEIGGFCKTLLNA